MNTARYMIAVVCPLMAGETRFLGWYGELVAEAPDAEVFTNLAQARRIAKLTGELAHVENVATGERIA